MKLALVVLVAGCSFARTSNPQSPPQPPNCSTSKTPLYVDTAIAAVALVGGIVLAIDSGINESRETVSGSIAVGLVLGSVAFGGSFHIGENRVKRCRAAHQVTTAPY